MTTGTLAQGYALAIYAPGRKQAPPVVYDLTSASIDIGSAEDNHIVLSEPDVAPYHLAVRRLDSGVYVLVDISVTGRHSEAVWQEQRGGDSLYCPEHGQLPKHSDTRRCPMCGERERSLWLLRPLQPGDVFPIGARFRATVLSQLSPRQNIEGGSAAPSPWPDAHWLENPPHPPLTVGAESLTVIERGYPFDDSNLWGWNPPEAPFPVFIHHRANRFVAKHAGYNRNREIGGLLLGRVCRDPLDDVLYPVITNAIPARFATESRGQLTFTRETWLDLTRQREERHPGKEVVGWYHTHPGLDIFLSEWDLMIHRHFFRREWQVALVVDPHQEAGGFFVWAGEDILDPHQPHRLFRVADFEDENPDAPRTRIRIKLGEYTS
ncbi:MAG: Mov34/MPN/PAD-1 family protein [Anaerolineae bacterium]|nr:Mov34/MPN/PAD-1 family protein [Anaerolineae bacterium]